MKRMWISAAAAGLLILAAASAAPAQNPARQFGQFGTQRGGAPVPAGGPITLPARSGGYLGGSGGAFPSLPNTFNPGAFTPNAFNPYLNNPLLTNNPYNTFNPYNAFTNPYNTFANPYNAYANPYGYPAAPFFPANPYVNSYPGPWPYQGGAFGNLYNPYTTVAPWQNPLQNPLVNPSLLGVTGAVAPWQYPQLPFQNPALFGMWGLGAYGSALSNQAPIVGVNNGGFAAGAQK